MVNQGLTVQLSSLLEWRRSPTWDILKDPRSICDVHNACSIGVHDAQVFIELSSICDTCEQNLLSIGREPWFDPTHVLRTLVQNMSICAVGFHGPNAFDGKWVKRRIIEDD